MMCTISDSPMWKHIDESRMQPILNLGQRSLIPVSGENASSFKSCTLPTSSTTVVGGGVFLTRPLDINHFCVMPILYGRSHANTMDEWRSVIFLSYKMGIVSCPCYVKVREDPIRFLAIHSNLLTRLYVHY
jgi:hypothetical protein